MEAFETLRADRAAALDADEPGRAATVRAALRVMADDDALAIALHRLELDRDSAERWCSVAERDGERTAAEYLAAVACERAGDALAADAHLQRAISTGVALAMVADRAGWYAADRGDARAAAALWSPLDPKPVNFALVEAFAEVGRRTPGRNDQCWCGSGRKYKHCHLGQPERASLVDRMSWMQAKAVEFMQRADSDALEDLYALAEARALDPSDENSVAEAFADPIVVDTAMAEGGWWQRFLDARGPLLPEDERSLAESWLPIERTVHELTASAGPTVTLRPVDADETCSVVAPAVADRAHPGEYVCARVVPVGDELRILGGAFVVPPDEVELVTSLCRDRDAFGLCDWVRRSMEG
ncbi:MAG: SEC-C domain-containing protein [Ilumatobacteraceae bacterium]